MEVELNKTEELEELIASRAIVEDDTW